MGKTKLINVPMLLEEELPEIVVHIAKQYDIRPYIKNPDFLEERLYSWHQFGLCTHTKKVHNIFLKESKVILAQWGFNRIIEGALSEKIEGIEKKILLETSIPLHDLGKIISYGKKEIDREHEKLSTVLLHQDFLRKKLHSYGLLNPHIEYISKCIRTHDVVGKEIRDVLKNTGKLNLKDLYGETARNLFNEILNKYFNIRFEIGLYFLCDSLGKTDMRGNLSESEIYEFLLERRLPLQLKKALHQLPINMQLAKVYLEKICS